MMADTFVDWLLTYLVHSTLLLGLAFCAHRLLGERRLALQEALFRAALLGGLVTPTLQLGFALRPVGGVVLLPNSGARRAEVALPPTLPLSVLAELRTAPIVSAGSLQAATESRGAAPRRAFWLPSIRSTWRPAVLVVWVGLAALGLVRLIVAWLRMRGLLAGRCALLHGEVAQEVSAVARALGIDGRVRLSTAPRLVVPVAVGVIRPEVCLPVRVLEDLSAEERLALCAHELAHVARRDPGWIILAGAVEALLPFQALNGLARRRLTDLAECLADDLALAASVKPVGLARSLVGVASWSIGERAPIPATAAGAFSARSRLAFRVERLMNPVRHPERPRAFLLPMVAVVVLASALVTPAVSREGKDEEATSPEQASEVTAREPITAAVQQHPVPALRPVVAPRPKTNLVSSPHPAARPVPHAAPRRAEALADTQAQIERLAKRFSERAVKEARLEEEIQALVSRIQPNVGEIEGLSADLAQVAVELATEMSKAFGPGGGRGAHADAAARMHELQQRIRESAAKVQVPEEQLRAIRERAREMAERARPTNAELAELRELSARLAQDVAPKAEEVAAMAREAAEKAKEELRFAQEHMREAQERTRRAQEHALDAARSAAAKARQAEEEHKLAE
jgi:beta-lactamase regulating signal transducer with metallopeptidase domain